MSSNLMATLMKYPTAFGRIVLILMNNIYCIPTYVAWMTILIPLKHIRPDAYYKIEGYFFHWMLAIVSMWSYTAGYEIVELGDDITECRNRRTLVIANHQSTADVPLLMANFNTKDEVLPNIMWIMDRLFKYTNFGIVSIIHHDFFIAAGKNNRDDSVNALKEHIKDSFIKLNRKWMVLFPEGGFLRKRRAVSQRFATKNNLPALEYCTIPRVGALTAIMDVMCTEAKQNIEKTISLNAFHSDPVPNGNFVEKDNNLYKKEHPSTPSLLEYILDITIAYPDGVPLDLISIIFGFRDPCKTHMLYRLYKVTEIPKDDSALTQWLYDRFIEKNTLLENFYRSGKFYTDRTLNTTDIPQDYLRFILINLFFITSTYIHYQMLCSLYTYCVFLAHGFS